MKFRKSLVLKLIILSQVCFAYKQIAIFGPKLSSSDKLDLIVFSSIKDLEFDELGEMIKAVNEIGEESIKNCTQIFDSLQKCSIRLNGLKNFNVTGSFKSVNQNGSSEHEQSAPVMAVDKKYSVMIQTDKSHYKPGDEVKMRIFFIQSNGFPVPMEEINAFHVEIRNKYEEVIKTFTVADYRRVVYTRTFQIDQDAFLGTHKIHVWYYKKNDENVKSSEEDDIFDAPDDIEDKDDGDANENFYYGGSKDLEDSVSIAFEVGRFVLPEYELFVETQRNILSGTDILIKVHAKYTFGRFVKGTATLTATIDINGQQQRKCVKKVEISTVGSVIFKPKEDLNLVNNIQQYDVKVEVKFEEVLTKKTVTKDTVVSILVKESFGVLIEPENESFVPGKNYGVDVYLKDYNENLITNTNDHIELIVTKNYRTKLCQPIIESNIDTEKEQLPGVRVKNGKAHFIIQVPDNTTSMSIEASYRGFTSEFNTLKFVSYFQEYLSILAPKKSLRKANIPLKIITNSMKQEVPIFYMLAIGENGEIFPDKILRKKKKGRNVVEMKEPEYILKYQEWMSPSVNIIVFYPSVYGEIVVAATNVKIDYLTPNKVEISLDHNLFEPSKNISIKFHLDPMNSDQKASLHLLGVDRRVQLMGKGNDIDMERFFKQATQFRVKNEENIFGAFDDRYKDLEKFNAFILTNAYNTYGPDCDVQAKSLNDNVKLAENNDDLSGLKQSKKSGISIQEGAYIRKDFPETFMFEDIKGVESLEYELKQKVPDTITMFMVNAFVFHPVHGIGIAQEKNFTVFKDFFVETYLPYSIYVGEVLKLNVVVFNYIEKIENTGDSIEAEIQVEILNEGKSENGGFVIVNSSDCRVTTDHEKLKTATINIPYDSSANAFFPISATSRGNVTIKITATSNGKIDIIEKKLRVEINGIQKSKNIPFLLMLTKDKNLENHDFSYHVPEDCIKESIDVYGTVYGNLLGQVLNVGDLIKLPTGCPEQTFFSWRPNIIAYNYLKSINKLDKDTKDKIRDYITGHYQKLMKLAKVHDDGSFPHWNQWQRDWTYIAPEKFIDNFLKFCFDVKEYLKNWFSTKDEEKKEKNSRIWMTAHFANLLTKAKKTVGTVDDNYLVNALKFLKERQNNETGEFKGDSINKYDFGYDKEVPIALTAHVMIAFLESDHKSDFEDVIEKGIKYLKKSTIDLKSFYVNAFSAFALSLNDPNDEKLQELLDNLERNAQQPDYQQMFWYNGNETEKISAVNIELASYAMMAFTNSANSNAKNFKHKEIALKILNWLVRQKNSLGGFHTSTDTVIAIDAIAKISENIKRPNITKIGMNFNQTTTDNLKKTTFVSLNEINKHVVGHLKFDPNSKTIKLNAAGNGIAMASVTYDYKIAPVNASSGTSFDLKVKKVFIDQKIILNLTICVSNSDKNGNIKSGMPIIEVNLPSGYKFDDEEKIYDEINKDVDVKVRKVEHKKDRTVVNLYFDSIDSKEKCFTLSGYQKILVLNLDKTYVSVYDYYNREDKLKSVYYDPSDVSTC